VKVEVVLDVWKMPTIVKTRSRVPVAFEHGLRVLGSCLIVQRSFNTPRAVQSISVGSSAEGTGRR
jgi:hypothetical protein